MVDKVEKIKNRSKRGRPVLLNDVLKQTIILYKSSNPDWSAGKILENIKANYHHKLKQTHPDWPDTKIREQSVFPGVNRIQRYLKEISPLDNQQSALDEKWHLGSMQDYPISPEAVKNIFMLKARGKDYISIRIARWISRLSALPLPIDALYLAAMEYSTAEEIAEISRTKLNTSNIDSVLLEHMKNPRANGNGLKKADDIPVRNDIAPVKNDVTPVKNDTAPVKIPVTPIKTDISPVKTDTAPVKTPVIPVKTPFTTIKTYISPMKNDKAPVKNDIAPVKNDKTPMKNDAAEKKPQVNVPERKPKETIKNWHLPDMSERQSGINEFLKFVERQKDIEL
jgi:hypothetical protein